MKTFALLACMTCPCLAADFLNFTFDEPDLTGSLTPVFPGGPLEGSPAQLLRGWTALANGLPLEKSGYSPVGTFGFYYPVGLADNAFDFRQEDFGKHQVILQSLLGTGPTLQLKQTGTIPADAATLGIFNGGHTRVLINGELVGDSNISYPEFDVSQWAGQTVELEFDFGRGQQLGFDVFGFKPVPEPEMWALFGVGAAAVFYFAGRKR